MTDIYSTEQATVYRTAQSGRRYLTRTAAIMGHAKAKFRLKHPCECERGDYASGYPGYNCGMHDVFDRVVPRYVRFLRFVLRKRREEPQTVVAVDPSVADPGKPTPRAKDNEAIVQGRR